MRRSILVAVTLLTIAATLLSACGASTNAQSSTNAAVAMAPMSALPKAMQDAPARVRSAYQFAVANPDALKNVPCYCGCGSMGHTSNYSCYVESVDAAGQVKFDSHALGCSICVDITQDAMRLSKQGKSPQDIKAYVDKTYGQYGPSNMK